MLKAIGLTIGFSFLLAPAIKLLVGTPIKNPINMALSLLIGLIILLIIGILEVKSNV